MKKVLLIEDRYIRQNFFIDETGISLINYSDILDNFTHEQYDELELQIENNSFDFENYDYIISHKSIGEENRKTGLIDNIRDYCNTHQKTLVLFSGGISANYYDTSEFELLELNSKTFYSANLELFLKAIKNDSENVLMLCYGEQWKQNIVSNMLEKINIFLSRNDKEKVIYSKFSNAVSIDNLESIRHEFYKIDTQTVTIHIDEIKKIQDSLYRYINTINTSYLDKTQEQLSTLVIYNNDNIIDFNQFDDFLEFTPDISEIDKYISETFIYEINSKEFDVIYIKDNLSSNYLELYGLRVAYHIRFSEALGDKKNIPIVILSDFSSNMLNKLDPMARILLTKNIFLIKNTKEAIEKTQTIDFHNLTPDEYKTEFLDKVKVEQPKDYLTHHSIANEWSMYRWAEYLDVNTPDIQKIRSDISSMLYFKYLQAKFPIKRTLFAKHKQEIQGRGKILYIDDEWEKGWKSIFEHLSLENQDYSLETVEEVYKDKAQGEIITFIMAKVVSVNPDVVILDMRLHEDDFLENVKLADFTGIQIFNQIKEINPGIQVIIFTASSNSLLLDELYSYDSSILGYVKKEHPKNYNLTTQGNINKLINLLNKGLAEKYLKDIYITKKKILEILEIDIFSSYMDNKNKYETHWLQIKKEASHVFDILNSNTSNKYPYAMLSIARSLEAVLSIFIVERQFDNIYWDKEDCNVRTFEDKIIGLMAKFGYEISNLNAFITRRNKYIHSNSSYVDVTKIEVAEWFNILLEIIKVISNPPNYTHL